jgi:hypothetical protein
MATGISLSKALTSCAPLQVSYKLSFYVLGYVRLQIYIYPLTCICCKLAKKVSTFHVC